MWLPIPSSLLSLPPLIGTEQKAVRDEVVSILTEFLKNRRPFVAKSLATEEQHPLSENMYGKPPLDKPPISLPLKICNRVP